MSQVLYKVLMTGKTLPDADLREAKQRFASTFKISPESTDRYFLGKPVVIKSGVDLPTAQKYRAAIEKAGCEASIMEVEEKTAAAQTESPDQPSSVKASSPETLAGSSTDQPKDSTSEQEADASPVPPSVKASSPETFTGSSTEQPEDSTSEQEADASPASPTDDGHVPEKIVIELPPKPASLQYAPLECRTISGIEGGLNFNRFSCEAIPYGEILSATVYALRSGAKPKPRLMIFIAKQKKPLITDAASIRYDDFADTHGEDTESSLRKFVAYLLAQAGTLRVDPATDSFLDGASPVILKKDEPSLATSVGSVLDTEDLFILQTMKDTLSAKAGHTNDAPVDGQTAPLDAQTAAGPHQYSEEELLRMFIGPHADHYLERVKSSRDGEFGLGWHWPAFLAPVFWHFYRKAYLPGMGFLAITLVILLSALLHPALLLLMVFVHVASGLTADALYAKLAISTVRLIEKNQLIDDKAASVTKDGGVNPTAVYITSGAFAVILLIGSAIFIMQFVMKKTQDLYAKATEMPMPMQGMPPGAPVPQNPEEAMQMAYDTTAKAELRKACTAAQMFFAEEGGGGKPLTLDALKKYGFNPPGEIQFRLITGSPQNLRMAARHLMGTQEIMIDQDCRFVNTQ